MLEDTCFDWGKGILTKATATLYENIILVNLLVLTTFRFQVLD